MEESDRGSREWSAIEGVWSVMCAPWTVAYRVVNPGFFSAQLTVNNPYVGQGPQRASETPTTGLSPIHTDPSRASRGVVQTPECPSSSSRFATQSPTSSTLMELAR